MIQTPEYWKNDIALIKLEEPVPTGDEIPEIRNIKLPNQSAMNFPADDQECIMKGWGCTEKGAFSLRCLNPGSEYNQTCFVVCIFL